MNDFKSNDSKWTIIIGDVEKDIVFSTGLDIENAFLCEGFFEIDLDKQLSISEKEEINNLPLGRYKREIRIDLSNGDIYTIPVPDMVLGDEVETLTYE